MIHKCKWNIDKILGIQYHFYRRKILQKSVEIFILGGCFAGNGTNRRRLVL